MISEDSFQNALDADPDNHGLRLVFADWLQEHGDARCEGYRWLGMNGKRPQKAKSDIIMKPSWDWWKLSNRLRVTNKGVPPEFYVKLAGYQHKSHYDEYREYPTRREAENAFCAAYLAVLRAEAFAAELAKVRAELLTMQEHYHNGILHDVDSTRYCKLLIRQQELAAQTPAA